MSSINNARLGRAGVFVALVVLLIATLVGCESLGSLVRVASLALPVSVDSAALAATAVTTIGDMYEAGTSPFTPQQEYYIGRAVAANILSRYDRYDDRTATDYVNRLGQALALLSPRPALFAGYSFMILDTDEINAFATPGGHIFVSRGMLRLTDSEDELAAVLAHEIGHVVGRHGLGNIRTARVIDAAKNGTFEALDTVTPAQLPEITGLFKDTVGDVMDVLITRGYSGPTEREADETAVAILATVGYDPYALVRVLEKMEAAQEEQYEGDDNKIGFSKTHPRPSSRVDTLSGPLKDLGEGSQADASVTRPRYSEALAGI